MSEVPADMRTSFEQTYPNAEDVEWEMEGESYKVEFEIDREDHEIWYASDGNTAKMEKEISDSDLPQAIHSAISYTYEGYTIDGIDMIEENGVATYEVELEKSGDDDKKVLFDTDGKVLNEMND
ncbi:PepSY-like domain-containing protein [Pricia sp.]|uniref:PepSY-like domain-containing protein n=1 Tax=Pricia sp. TaxID=2268138 RepID=UPI0035946EA7